MYVFELNKIIWNIPSFLKSEKNRTFNFSLSIMDIAFNLTIVLSYFEGSQILFVEIP